MGGSETLGSSNTACSYFFGPPQSEEEQQSRITHDVQVPRMRSCTLVLKDCIAKLLNEKTHRVRRKAL